MEVQEFIITSDNQIKGYFSDKSSMIIHSNKGNPI